MAEQTDEGPGPHMAGRPSGDGTGGGAGTASSLPRELRALGRSLDAPGASVVAETMVERVLGQILAEQLPPPVAEPPGRRARLRAARRWTRTRWRSLTAALCGLLTVLVLTPPVRAEVLDWFGFGGVQVRYDPSAVPSASAHVPDCGGSLSLAEAERRAGFAPVVPDALGAPDAVTVSREPRGPSLVSLCWHADGDTVRLDEFPAWLDAGFVKTVRRPPEWLPLSGPVSADATPEYALWFPHPHLLSFWLVDSDGRHHTRQVRTAGPTLLWSHGRDREITLRLEGVVTRGRALEIADSVDRKLDPPSGR